MELGMYKNVKVLDKNEDASLRIKELNNCEFAKNLRDCAITIDEFYECCKSQPIVFAKNEEGEYFSLAIMGIEEGTNLFVDADDFSWQKNEYLPAFVRRYPFVFAEGADGTLALAVDMDSKAVNKKSGEALFDKESQEPTEYTQSVMNFLEEYQVSHNRTKEMVKALDDLELLEDATAEINLSGSSYSFTGFLRVNEERLNELDDEATLSLVRSGYYKLVLAHLLSLKNFARRLNL